MIRYTNLYIDLSPLNEIGDALKQLKVCIYFIFSRIIIHVHRIFSKTRTFIPEHFSLDEGHTSHIVRDECEIHSDGRVKWREGRGLYKVICLIKVKCWPVFTTLMQKAQTLQWSTQRLITTLQDKMKYKSILS